MDLPAGRTAGVPSEMVLIVEALILQGPPATLTDLHLWLEGLKGRLAGPFVVDKETAPSSSTREVTSEGPFAAARQKFMAPEI